jgi:uncharacterized protein
MPRVLAAALLFLAALPALADGVVYAQIPAHPALWTVHGSKGTAYLFGSIHALPPNVDWHTKEIDAALARSDVLVYELQMDATFQARVQKVIRERGMLPEGQHLRDMLSAGGQKDFDAKVKETGLPLAFFDRMRPWLADMSFEIEGMKKQRFAAGAGVESAIEAADQDKRPVIGLETIDEQIALLAPADPKVELQAFEASLKSEDGSGGSPKSRGDMGPLLDAWMHGNVAKLDRLINAAISHFPDARRALLDDRNKAWAAKLEALLGEDKTYFVTVGAGHLGGAAGVPNLLRAEGLKVEGP